MISKRDIIGVGIAALATGYSGAGRLVGAKSDQDQLRTM
jgi:hypothetical protein